MFAHVLEHLQLVESVLVRRQQIEYPRPDVVVHKKSANLRTFKIFLFNFYFFKKIYSLFSKKKQYSYFQSTWPPGWPDHPESPAGFWAVAWECSSKNKQLFRKIIIKISQSLATFHVSKKNSGITFIQEFEHKRSFQQEIGKTINKRDFKNSRRIRRSLRFLEPELFPLVEQVRFRAAEIHDLRTAVSVLKIQKIKNKIKKYILLNSRLVRVAFGKLG